MAVDEMLAREGRLRFLSDPEEISLDGKKPAGAVEARTRRDPRDLLQLALPWIEASS
jgi:hypothetical protein